MRSKGQGCFRKQHLLQSQRWDCQPLSTLQPAEKNSTKIKPGISIVAAEWQSVRSTEPPCWVLVNLPRFETDPPGRVGWGRHPASKPGTVISHFSGWVTCQHTFLFYSVFSVLPPPQHQNNKFGNWKMTALIGYLIP